MTWWGWLIMFGVSALLFAINEAPAVAYKRGYRAGVRAYRRRLNDVVSERDERRKHYPWRQPTGDQWADRVRRRGNHGTWPVSDGRKPGNHNVQPPVGGSGQSRGKTL